MIECATPQDILKYKAKFIGNFTAREAVCLGLGVAAGLGCYFTILSGFEYMVRLYIAIPIILPFFLFGFVKPYGMPLEKILFQAIYDNFICPSVRKNETHFPEYEKYRRSDFSLPESATEEVAEKDSKNKKSKAKKSKQQSNNKEKKIKRSKEHKAIK